MNQRKNAMTSDPQALLIRTSRRSASSAFTLVELVVVILILGILSAVAAPKIFYEVEEADDAVVYRNRAGYQDALDQQFARTGAYPTTIEATWFSGNRLPGHPNQPDGVPLLEVVDSPGVEHPTSIVLSDSSAGCYWYNYAEGVLRARIHYDDDDDDTIELYNETNHTDYDGAVE